ncbi:MAG: hypothetical protein H7A49_04265 [Akkermansiaceae bacterium]|nr:hypothetical protein [Akkermansiaceae bacterium]
MAFRIRSLWPPAYAAIIGVCLNRQYQDRKIAARITEKPVLVISFFPESMHEKEPIVDISRIFKWRGHSARLGATATKYRIADAAAISDD